MENKGLLWSKNEDQQLLKLYQIYNMNISEIAQIHKRSTNAINLRLLKLQSPIETKFKNKKIITNFIWERALEQEKEDKKTQIYHHNNRFEFFCKIISETINDMYEELDNKIKQKQSLDDIDED
jgi:hypothetical protein